jgi:hypothetical protein
MDQNEITSALVQLGIDMSEEEASHLIADYDVDGNGTLVRCTPCSFTIAWHIIQKVWMSNISWLSARLPSYQLLLLRRRSHPIKDIYEFLGILHKSKSGEGSAAATAVYTGGSAACVVM